MTRFLLMFSLLFGCVSAPDPIIPIFEEPTPIKNEVLILSAANQRVKIAFNQAYYKSQKVGGFHVTWNGVYQGVYLVSDELDLPYNDEMYLVLSFIDRDGMRMNKTVTHDLDR